MIAADYLHLTSRALEPQLHHHVVVANYGIGPDGKSRALDSRFLFHHAKTASYLAAAELRHQLTARLGVEWTAVENGIAEIVGVPRAVLEAMSSRSKEIDAAAESLGVSSAKARQVAAWDTRAAKEHGVDLEELFTSWDERLTAAGYGSKTQAFGHPPRRAGLAAHRRGTGASGSEGSSASTVSPTNEAVFDRRHVVQRLAELAGDRLRADEIDAMADELLADSDLVELQAPKERGTRRIIRRRDGRVVELPGEKIYSTVAMIALERKGLRAYGEGRRAGAGDRAAVRSSSASSRTNDSRGSPTSSGASSSRSRRRGCASKPASARPGAARPPRSKRPSPAGRPPGTASSARPSAAHRRSCLSEETGVEGRTVASVIARYFDHGDTSVIDERTVVLSTRRASFRRRISSRSRRLVEEQGATLRLVGDPAQHSAVAAGGMFRHLVERHPEEVPQLTHLYRQQGPRDGTGPPRQQGVPRGEDRRSSRTAAARRPHRRGGDEGRGVRPVGLRVVCGATERREADPQRRRSAMTAEHHSERRELNARARALLVADGTLEGA